ncbi:MAG: insulinase family protein [Myxococcota bacterium]
MPPGPLEQRVALEDVDAATVSLVFHGPVRDAAHREDLALITALVRKHLGDRLRNVLGATYHVDADLQTEPLDEYALVVSFQCDPARIDALAAAAVGEIEALRAGEGVTDRTPAGTTAIAWATRIGDAVANGEDLEAIAACDAWTGTRTAEALTAVAAEALDASRRIVVLLDPSGR